MVCNETTMDDCGDEFLRVFPPWRLTNDYYYSQRLVFLFYKKLSKVSHSKESPDIL